MTFCSNCKKKSLQKFKLVHIGVTSKQTKKRYDLNWKKKIIIHSFTEGASIDFNKHLVYVFVNATNINFLLQASFCKCIKINY